MSGLVYEGVSIGLTEVGRPVLNVGSTTEGPGLKAKKPKEIWATPSIHLSASSLQLRCNQPPQGSATQLPSRDALSP